MSDWDDLAEEVAAERQIGGPPCSIKALYASLSASDAASVQAVIDQLELPASAVCRALTRRLGVAAPTRQSISRHRRNECTCMKGGRS